MGRIVDELKTVIGFEISKNSERDLKKFKNGISSLRKQALLAGAAFAGFGIASTKIIQGVDQQAKFARAVGLSFESLRKFQFAARKAGASTSEFNSFVGNLARTIVSLQPGQFNQALLRLKVAARDATGQIRPLDDVILDISNSLKRFNAIRRLQFAGQFGGGVNIANFLGQGPQQIRRDIQEAIASGFVIPERVAGQFAAFFDDSLLKLRSTIQGFSEVIIASLLPPIIEVVDNLEEWILKNQELLSSDIGDFLKGAGDAFRFFGKAIKFALDAINSLLSPITKTNKELSEAKILGFAAASAVGALAVAAIFAAGEWVLLATAITGVLALLPQIEKIWDFLPDVINPLKLKENLRELKQLGDPREFKLLSQLAKSGGNLEGLINPQENLSVPAPQSVTNNSANKNVTLNNTFNISGADPSQIAKRVTEQLELVTALQSASPGFNRAKVG